MDNLPKILIAFELHDVASIRECFANGVDPNAIIDGKPLIYALINMYSRGPLFKDCIWEFVSHGLEFDDKALLAVLLDDAIELNKILSDDPVALRQFYSLDCTFTPLYEASLLHICAEYNHLACATVLIKHGADINAKAGKDAFGFGGHTPIFHTVNQDANKCMDMLKYLLSLNADLLLTVPGLIWGKGYDWETFIPAVNPVSYAMMGLLRQFQRTEPQIYAVVKLLMKSAYGIEYSPANLPNKYLAG
jgi:hypothetical protein